MSVLGDAVKLVTEDAGVFEEDWKYRRLLCNSLSSSNDRRNTIRSYGFLVAAYVLACCSAPFPLTPFLIQLAVQGDSAFEIDKEFLRLLHPSALQKLQPWMDWKDAEPRTSLSNLPATNDLHYLLVEAGFHVSFTCFPSRRGSDVKPAAVADGSPIR